MGAEEVRGGGARRTDIAALIRAGILASCAALSCSACAGSCRDGGAASQVEPRAATTLTKTEPAPTLHAPAASKPAAQSRSESCAGIGAVACDVAPSADKPAELCAQVSKCLLGKGSRDDEFGVITSVEDCEELSNVTPAPSETGLLSVGFVTVTGELGEVPAEGTFLFARGPAGLCLVDRVLNMEWFHGGSFENELKARWEGSSLHIQAQRLKRIPLDEAADDSSGADVDWVTCDRQVYDAQGGKLKRLKTESLDKACMKRGR